MSRLISFCVRGGVLRLRNVVNGSIYQTMASNSRSLSYKITEGGQGGPSSQGAVESYNGYRNRLGLEKSPYLIQHANNPVNWYPWGEEAFKKAKEEKKPIFLSVGYSTCHWCHVMEDESFKNEEIGRLLNEYFVPIKLDREERPDVDRIYMTFLQAAYGKGGWPMSIWLTPDLEPFTGGTYFPPDDRYYGQYGFKSTLENIISKWNKEAETIEVQGKRVVETISSVSQIQKNEDACVPPYEAALNAFDHYNKNFDKLYGGFKKAPKFPHPSIFEMLFSIIGTKEFSELYVGGTASNMAYHTLDRMSLGGIFDHIGKGFHRYSVDDMWHVPHFEKMLYDQGQLAGVYASAYQLSSHEQFATVLRDILQYVEENLSDMEGGFYSAEDADSYPSHDSTEKKEGAFYVWSHQELKEILSVPIEANSWFKRLTLADIVSKHYDTKRDGNVNPYIDPRDELKNLNVLHVTEPLDVVAESYKISPEEVKSYLQQAKKIMKEARNKRPAPHLDNKMLTSWNAHMITGFAKAAAVLDDPAYLERALRAIEFIKTHLYSHESGILLRSCYAGIDTVTQMDKPIEGFSDDYAVFIKALLDTYEVSYQEDLLEFAEKLQEKQDALFWDEKGKGYFSSSGSDSSLVYRLKEDQDTAEPSSNSISAMNLLRMSNFLGRPDLSGKAEDIFCIFSERMEKVPQSLPAMVSALLFYHSTPKQIIIRGEREARDTQELLRCVHSRFLPHKVLMLADGKEDGFLYNRLKVMASLEKKDGKATAYICENYSCSLPVTSVSELDELLSELRVPHTFLKQ